MLQRSRALSSAEIRDEWGNLVTCDKLQRSRALSSAEIEHYTKEWFAPLHASTEPRSFERGDGWKS